MKKRVLSLLLVVVMTFAMTACGSSAKGKYVIESMTSAGMTFSVEDLKTYGTDVSDTYIELKSFGKAEIKLTGEDVEKFKYTDDKFISDNEEISYTIKDGVLSVDFGQGVEMTFKKK